MTRTQQNEFAKRRRQLMRMMGKDSIAILPAATEKTRNRDVHFPYRQDSDFLYLTGFHEPEAVMVLMPGRKQGEYLMFCRSKDPEKETWDGRRAGQEGVKEDFGADDAFPIDDLEDILPGLLEGCERVYYTMGCHPDYDKKIVGWVNHLRSMSRAGTKAPGEFVALEHYVHDMRLYKSREELKSIKRAIRISVAAHKKAMSNCRPGMMEYEVEAELLHEFARGGGEPAYPSIVGGGVNGCILHYVENNAELKDGDLLLIDAGVEIDGYASDITRTFPVNGRFSKEQKALYQVVLDAQEAAIKAVKPGNHWDDPHAAAVKVITKGLIRLGLLKGALKKNIKEGAYRKFYMHRTGHWLGLDVHDVGDYKVDEHWRVLEPGMLLTVEPGIYIAPGTKGVPKKWWGIGIRIEDDVLVTRKGCEVLSEALPKHVEELEALVGATV